VSQSHPHRHSLDDTVVVSAGYVVVGPPDVPHGFTNTGASELRLVAIHGAPRFVTEWLAGDDPIWRSAPAPDNSVERRLGT
jgi:mannose-6-phosphate isomerase-like protein (cupin superfamily)